MATLWQTLLKKDNNQVINLKKIFANPYLTKDVYPQDIQNSQNSIYKKTNNPVKMGKCFEDMYVANHVRSWHPIPSLHGK